MIPKIAFEELEVAVPPLATQRAIVELERLRQKEEHTMNRIADARKRLVSGLALRAALKGNSTEYPLESLKLAGVDMASPLSIPFDLQALTVPSRIPILSSLDSPEGKTPGSRPLSGSVDRMSSSKVLRVESDDSANRTLTPPPCLGKTVPSLSGQSIEQEVILIGIVGA